MNPPHIKNKKFAQALTLPRIGDKSGTNLPRIGTKAREVCDFYMQNFGALPEKSHPYYKRKLPYEVKPMRINEKNYIIGIDPGLQGGVAVFDGLSLDLVTAFKMPIDSVEFDVNKVPNSNGIKKHTNIDTYELALKLELYASQTLFAVVEKPHAMPGQGVSSMFKFGLVCGIVQGAVAACGIKMHLVDPAVWKSVMGLTSDKRRSLNKAIERFPKHSNLFVNMRDEGKAEAAFLCLFGYERFYKTYKKVV